MSTSSSDEDDNFLRIHAKAIAEALQQQESEQASSSGAPKNKSQRERMIHDAYVALCHDDPRVESDLACQYLATALLDSKSPYALSGPLVEGIRQLCVKQQGTFENKPDSKPSTEAENLINRTTSSPKGSAMLAWAIYARIPLICCQATSISEVSSYLGSYRPPPPPNPLASEDEKINFVTNSPQKQEEADRLAELLSQPPVESENNANNEQVETQNGEDDEVWAAESDPSDFEFDSGFSHEQQMTDFQDTFAAWMIDRSDPLKLSKPPADVTTWKQVRHAVMDLASQLNYRQIASVWNSENSATGLTGGRGPANILKQLTLTLLLPPTATGQSSRPSIFDSPDDDEDAIQPQRQLQAMAWYPLWVLRDATSTAASSNVLSQYLTLLQTLISVDAASKDGTPGKPTEPMAPATYVGLASLSALCQKFVADTDVAGSSQTPATIELYRSLRIALWETSDDLSHALEQEEQCAKVGDKADAGKSVDWILWTMLPLFEIVTNQRLQTGAIIVVKAESLAQRHHHQQTSQQWSSLLQSGLFRHLLLRLQALKGDGTPVLWHLLRRSLLHAITQSMSATSALGKYAWRFPSFISVVEIGAEAPAISSDSDTTAFSERFVDDLLWHLLCIELADSGSTAAPTVQWKSSTKYSSTLKPLPSRKDCQGYCWEGFHSLCSSTVRVMNLISQEENRKENLAGAEATEGKEVTPEKNKAAIGTNREQYQLVLRSFHRFVESLVACPLLANRLFDDELPVEGAPNQAQTFTKSLDTIQEALSQYKSPVRDTSNASQKTKGEDGEGKEGEVESKRAKQNAQDATLQEDIHTVRKALKVLRSLMTSKQAPGAPAGAMTSLDLTSSSKTD